MYYEATFIGGPAAGTVHAYQTAPEQITFRGIETFTEEEFTLRESTYKRTYLIEPNHDTGVLGQAFYAYQRTEIVETHTNHTSGRHTSNV